MLRSLYSHPNGQLPAYPTEEDERQNVRDDALIFLQGRQVQEILREMQSFCAVIPR